MDAIVLNTNQTVETTSLYYEEVDYKSLNIKFIYDKKQTLFGILIWWEFRKDILDLLLDKYDETEISLYITNYEYDNISEELNIWLIDLIYKYL